MSLSDSIARRLAIRSKIGSDPHKQALELARCAGDPVFWCNRWAWTFDPREEIATIPFNLFLLQEQFFCWLQDREEERKGGVVEKSRDMGITWCCCGYALHGWLFRDGYSVGFGSRKLELVDKKGDPDCIFEKIRFLLDNLPPWMLPEGFAPAVHANTARLINPANGATVTGEGGDEIGRGGRKSIYFIDESAFLEHPQSIEKSLSQTTNVRIDVSTPNGPGNPFATKRHSGKWPVFTFHWRDDPRKGEAWYELQKERLDPVTLAQEVDIDYSASIEGICIPARYVRAAVDLKLTNPDGSPYEPSSFVTAGFDIAGDGEGGDANVLTARRGPVVINIDSWTGLDPTQNAGRVRRSAEDLDVKDLFYDVVGIGLGVKGALNSFGTLRFTANAVNWGEAPTKDRWPDGKRSDEMFRNLRAELWWKLRERFRKAYEFKTQGIPHPPDEMISIPNHQALIADLSMPLVETTDGGKIQLESKAKMKARGVKSPDFGDSLAYSYAPKTGGTIEVVKKGHRF